MNERILAGRYRLQDAVGGRPDLFHAEDESLQRKVAVKLLMGARAGANRQRWEQEIAKAAGLHYPHLLAIYDVVAEADQIYLITEDMEGDTLSRWLRTQAPLPVDSAVAIIHQLAGAVVQTEKHGLHDISIDPAVVLVTREGFVKVISYGPLHSGPTPTYRQLLQTLGALLYEMLTGRTYSEFISTRQIIDDVHVALTQYSGELSWLPERLEQATFRALGLLAEGSYEAVSDLYRDIKVVHHALTQQLEASVGTVEEEKKPPQVPEKRAPEKRVPEKRVQENLLQRFKNQDKKQPFKRTPFTYVFALLAVVIVSGGIWWTLAEKSNSGSSTLASNTGQAVNMPDLTNKTKEQAMQILAKDGISQDVIQWVYQPSDDKSTLGKIYRQSVDPNTPVSKSNQVLILTINGDPAQMNDSGTSDGSSTDSSGSSDNSGSSGSSDNNSSSNGSGSNPSSGGSNVQTAKGQVPDLQGLSLSDAQQLLLKLGYHYSYNVQSGGSTPSGTVYQQNPPAGTQAPQGSSVNFTVNP